MSGVYWGLTALALLNTSLEEESSSGNGVSISTSEQSVINWILTCQDNESGG